jgi:hypothetical protein
MKPTRKANAMGKCRKASKRRRRPECDWCEQYIRREMQQHLKRCHALTAAVIQAQEYTNDAWMMGQFFGIPRCVQFPYSGACCGQYGADGSWAGFCPPP